MSVRFLFISFLMLASTVVLAQSKLPDPAKQPDPKKLQLASVHALVMDLNTNEILYERNADAVVPIASVTKLMTALVYWFRF